MFARNDVKAPFWAAEEPPPQYDIARLRPPALSVGERFETKDDIKRRRGELESRLEKGDALAKVMLKECARGYYMCEKPYCPGCGRTFRRWMFAGAYGLFQAAKTGRIVTIFIADVPEGGLAEFDVSRAKAALRMRMRRAGIGEAVIIGGLEASWRHRLKVWRIHAHLLALDAPRSFFAALKRTGFTSLGLKRVVVQEIKDPVKQVSYLLKFSTGHRPHGRTGATRSRQVPLRDAALRELVRFYDAHRFEDFLITIGVRRSAHKLLRA